MRRSVIASQLENALRTTVQAPGLQLVELDGERTAHDDEAQPWVSVKYGPAGHNDWVGVVPAVAHFRRAPGGAAESLPMIVKINVRESMAGVTCGVHRETWLAGSAASSGTRRSTGSASSSSSARSFICPTRNA